MSDWKRKTQEITFQSLPAEIKLAIDQHIEQYNLGPILEDVLMCIQTDSEKVKKSLFGGAETVRMSAIVTPRWLVWAVDGRKTEAAVLSAQLVNITVQDYAQTQFAKMILDSGIQVNGMFTDASESASAFIGLDKSPAGQRFKEIVIQVAQDVKK